MKPALFLLLVAVADCSFALNPRGPPHQAGPRHPPGTNLGFGPLHPSGPSPRFAPPHRAGPLRQAGPPHRSGPHHRFGPNLLHVPHNILLPVITDFNLISNSVKRLAEIPLQFLNCTVTAVTKILACAADMFADFLCSQIENGQLDMEAFKKASCIFIESMEQLGCKSPVSNITKAIAELVKKVKVPLVKSLNKNPAIVSAVKLSCSAEVVLRIFRHLLGANNTTC